MLLATIIAYVPALVFAGKVATICVLLNEVTGSGAPLNGTVGAFFRVSNPGPLK